MNHRHEIELAMIVSSLANQVTILARAIQVSDRDPNTLTIAAEILLAKLLNPPRCTYPNCKCSGPECSIEGA